MQVNTLVLEAGDLQASASGTGRLDATLQPVLDLTARVQGHRAALDRLVQAGVIQASAAVAAKAVLGLLSGRDPGAPATLPIRIAGGGRLGRWLSAAACARHCLGSRAAAMTWNRSAGATNLAYAGRTTI